VSEIEPDSQLDFNGGKIAQDCAVRLICFSSTILPSDKGLRPLIEQQIVSDTLELALHGRRQMEHKGKKSATLKADPIWPASKVEPPNDKNLIDLFGAMIHAKEIKVVWENADSLFGTNPYQGRSPQFAGSIKVSKGTDIIAVSIGSFVASYIGSVQNHLSK
jgi:hypothetical protein